MNICDNGYVSFSFDNKHLKYSLRIVPDNIANTGSIFFKTATGEKWLPGEPKSTKYEGDNYCAKWETDNRLIIINFKKDSDKYDFSFSALPDTGIIGWGFNIAAEAGEYFTGLTERVVDGDQSRSWKPGIKEAMDIRGQAFEMQIHHSLSLYNPFFVSSSGYGVFVNGTWPGKYDFCKENAKLVKFSFEGPSLTGIFYVSGNPGSIIKEHSLKIGPSIVPPKWAFLPWRWRNNVDNKTIYYDSSKVSSLFNSLVTEDILMMGALDIPCGVYFIDRPWAKTKYEKNYLYKGFADYEWDTERIPRPQEMIGWMGSKNINCLLWIAPWITGDWVKTAHENGYTVPKRSLHNRYGKVIPVDKYSALMDFTNRKAVNWWQENGPAKVLKDGIKGFKLDRGDRLVPHSGKFVYNNGESTREMINAYPVYYQKATYEIARRIYGDDFVLLSRAGYTGSPRFSVFWGGDVPGTSYGLRSAIIQLQKSLVMGFPIFGTDAGGTGRPLDREIAARWIAFSCFNPIMEVGPTLDRAPWDMPSAPHYDTTLIAIWSFYAKLHTRLADYSYNLAKEAHRTGMPIVRPLFLEHPEQKDAWTDWQTYKYGPDILISAIWQKGATKHRCYLPAGNKWVDAWNKDSVYDGGQYVEVNTPMYKIPIFLVENSKLDLGDLNQIYEESFRKATNKPNLQVLEKKNNF